MGKRKAIKQRAVLSILIIIAAALFTLAGRNNPLPQYNQGSLEISIHPSGKAPGDINPKQNIVGLDDIVFTPPSEVPINSANFSRPRLEPLSLEYINQLLNFDYLISRIFLVDPETTLFQSDIHVEAFLAADLTIDTAVNGPQVLIFHTHSGEMFIDSNPDYPMSGIMGVGEHLAKILAETHGIETMHYKGRFDFFDGRPMRQGSYERMEPIIKQILADNPSIQVVIDMHRDGVGDHLPPFVTYVDGVRTAQIMFFNGLSRRIRNGEPEAVPWLPNPYQTENLNFSFRLQLAANQLHPGLARRIYLRAFRYSLHMAPLSTLVEVGNQHNTFQDAVNAMVPLAEIIAAVVLGDE